MVKAVTRRDVGVRLGKTGSKIYACYVPFKNSPLVSPAGNTDVETLPAPLCGVKRQHLLDQVQEMLVDVVLRRKRPLFSILISKWRERQQTVQGFG